MQRVLIVEDNGRRRAELESAVLEAGVDVVTVADGPAAQQALATQRFDVMLLEPEAPGGRELLRDLRARGNAIEVLLVTERSRPAALVELFKLGVADYVAQPVKREELLEKLRRILERRRRASQKAAASAGLEYRPARDVLLAVADDAERAHLAGLLGAVSHVAAVDAATIARRAKLYACSAALVDPALPGLDWPAFVRSTRQDMLVVGVGGDGGETVDAVLPRPVRDISPLVEALRADADPVLMSGNVLRVQRGVGAMERWFNRVRDELSISLGGLGMARTTYAIVDLSAAPR